MKLTLKKESKNRYDSNTGELTVDVSFWVYDENHRTVFLFSQNVDEARATQMIEAFNIGLDAHINAIPEEQKDNG